MSATRELPPLDLNQRYSVSEALMYLRISKPTFYRLVKDGQLPTIEEYGRRFVPGSVIAQRSRLPAA